MLVNEEGYVLAHTSETQTLARANRIRVPIVETMLTSAVFSGSRKFEYEGKEFLGSYRLLPFGRLGVISTVEADEIFSAVYSIQRQNYWLMLIILTLAFIFTFLFSRTISGPIVRLVEATRRIEQGDYQVDIRPSTRDEIGILTHSFQNMARGLGERERIKDIFGKFVNQTIAEKALRGEISLGGEKKDAAIFFSDLRNFTGISESMEPAAVVEMLNRYFTAMVEKVYEFDGVVDKFIGDALMAHWGAVTSTGNDTKNAVEAALAMRMALMELNQEAGRTETPHLRFGIGINTGPVIAGQIGSNKKLEYTVIGDTVNLANRIEFLNKRFGTDILISSYSHKLVAGEYDFIEMPEITIKGKSKPEVLYAVLGRRGDPTTPKSLEELRTILGIEFDESMAKTMVSSVDILTGNRKDAL
jgi:adenylate cyclase